MLWLKAFHLVFMVTWFAGLLYLPRLFVYHATCEDEIGHRRFLVMERKLFAIMSIGGAATLAFGALLLLWQGWSSYTGAGWLWAKLALVALLIAFHAYCYTLIRAFRDGGNRHGHVFYRWINEIPAVVLIAVVILAVTKPF